MIDDDATIKWLPGLRPEELPGAVSGGGPSSRIHLLTGGQRGAWLPRVFEERRRGVRLPPGRTGWAETARLRPGFEARIVDISAYGALIEVPTRLHIGGRVELLLMTADTEKRLEMAGEVRHCRVAGLNPMMYRGAVEFDREIELLVLGPVAVRNMLTA